MKLLTIFLASNKHAQQAPNVPHPATKAAIASMKSGQYIGHAAQYLAICLINHLNRFLSTINCNLLNHNAIPL